MSDFPEKVLEEVTNAVFIPQDLLEYLFLLLVREKKLEYPSIQYSKIPTHAYADVYAYVLISLFKNSPQLIERGIKAPILGSYGGYTVPEGVTFYSSQLLNDLTTFLVPFRFSQSLRRKHTYILGDTGSGKTQLIQQLIMSDLDTNASIIVIDSQGDLINKLKRTKLIDPERLIIVDPVDSVTYPLALNMFDIGQGRTNLDPISQERHINGVVGLLNFVFSAVMDSSLTDKQSVVFNFCIRLLLNIPNATMETFVDILEKGVGDYERYIDQLPKVAQNFFTNAFPGTPSGRNEYGHTRQEILRRLYFLLENPTISRLFHSPKNMLNISEEMDSGKVILISTDRSLLKRQGCAFFGRYFISLIAQAMQDRLNRPEEHRRKCYVYIDECGDYLNSSDANISDILEKGRKYNVSLTLAHQQIQQLPQDIFQSVRTNTAIKFVGSCSPSDARTLKEDLYCETLHQSRPLHFVTITKGSRTPFVTRITYGLLEESEQRTDDEMETVMVMNRAKYCVSYKTPPQSPKMPHSEVKRDEPKDTPDDPLADYT